MPNALQSRFSSLTPAVRKKLWFFAAALGLGLICALITWPGIFYSDSYGRWFLARELARLNFAAQDDWLSVPPQLFMAVLYKLTGSYGSFTLVQSVLFFFTAFCAIDFFVPKGGLAGGILFVLCPIFYGFSVYVEMGVGCVTALLWLLMLLLGGASEKVPGWGWGRRLAYFILCCFLYFCMLGFRQNAFTVLPVVAFILFRLCKNLKNWWPMLMHGVAVALCFVVIAALPAVLRFGVRNGGGSLSVGFLWETVSMLGELEGKPEYAGMLDYLGEPGTTQNAVDHNNYSSIYGYHDYIPNTVVGQGDNASRIMKDYLYLTTHEPGTWFKVKTAFVSRALGISRPLSIAEYDYNRYDAMEAYGFRDTALRRAFHQSYITFQEAVTLFRRPWLVFLLGAGLLAAAWRFLQKDARYRLCLLYAAAVFFYGSFLVNTQSQEFRYFFVPLVLLYLCGAGCAGVLAGRLLDRIRGRRAGPKETEITPNDPKEAT